MFNLLISYSLDNEDKINFKDNKVNNEGDNGINSFNEDDVGNKNNRFKKNKDNNSVMFLDYGLLLGGESII